MSALLSVWRRAGASKPGRRCDDERVPAMVIAFIPWSNNGTSNPAKTICVNRRQDLRRRRPQAIIRKIWPMRAMGHAAVSTSPRIQHASRLVRTRTNEKCSKQNTVATAESEPHAADQDRERMEPEHRDDREGTLRRRKRRDSRFKVRLSTGTAPATPIRIATIIFSRIMAVQRPRENRDPDRKCSSDPIGHR